MRRSYRQRAKVLGARRACAIGFVPEREVRDCDDAVGPIPIWGFQ